ncbi:hemin uptake protein HemP [Kosakonia pseudosacchari]|uniref:hemin uptake protein HemP n=1 Tax=Kosakonia TaxID=1330547 RepID=UPI00201D81EE|nr:MULTISPECIES: hemin uptake protein HemP [Kosakonia]MCL6745978.1 hemin uptake protein HemP [Kosakonia sp. R1.Fl]MDZ7321206.1 hemin uptake protein HemP [Kosakonia sacchari]WBU47481.1 hemin uptake protein HemP [Kosakonia pseudosacchari]
MSHMDSTPASPVTPQEKPTHITPTDRRIHSRSLLGDEGRVVIEHNGQQYLLRQTHAGKLILTK